MDGKAGRPSERERASQTPYKIRSSCRAFVSNAFTNIDPWKQQRNQLKTTPGTLQGGASFATTHWSLVAQWALTDVPEAANALAQLCEPSTLCLRVQIVPQRMASHPIRLAIAIGERLHRLRRVYRRIPVERLIC